LCEQDLLFPDATFCWIISSQLTDSNLFQVLIIKKNSHAMKTLFRFSLITLIILPLIAKPQYYSDRPLEMSFEQSDFLFKPLTINPLGSESFREASLLTSSQTLAGIQRNPANLQQFDSDSTKSNYLYLNLGNSRTIQSYNQYYYPFVITPHRGYFYHPNPRQELSPLLNAAYITRLPFLNRALTLGASYQLISQGENYYAVPNNIYRNLAGYSLDGTLIAGFEGYDITDRYSGADEMYHEGHSFNLMAAWAINDRLTVGARAGSFIFERDGSVGSNNVWTQRPDCDSYWKSFEDRVQEYSHLDLSTGLTYTTTLGKIGVEAGLLTGIVKQSMIRDDDSKSDYRHYSNSDFSSYLNWYKSDQLWDHEGNRIHLGLLWERQISEGLDFRFMYRYSLLVQDLALKSSIESESENEYSYDWSSRLSEGSYFSKMHDLRQGIGERSISANMAGGSLSWDLGRNQRLSLGAIYSSRNHLTETSENVDSFAESESIHTYTTDDGTTTNRYYHKTVEDKTINWEYETRLRSIQIPIMYEYAFNDRFEMLLGINRVMNFHKSKNSTLILYHYRERIHNDQTNIQQNTGERITEPRERMSIINTNIIGALTFSPSETFNVQLLAAPGFEKDSRYDEYRTGMQLLLGINLRF
jgi:hypothetical protein